MAAVKDRYAGLWKIVRFNWHLYAIAAVGVLAAVAIANLMQPPWRWLVWIAVVVTVVQIVGSLVASHYTYDRSDPYSLQALDEIRLDAGDVVVNIHAGFDETSERLRQRFPSADLRVWDFYDPDKHREPSIRRARAAYPPGSETIPVRTDRLPLADGGARLVCLLFAVHEIREPDEQQRFLSEVCRVLADDGRVLVMEHLRDGPNLAAYGVGFLHFFSRTHWLRAFESVGLQVLLERKTNAFVAAFLLRKSGPL
jgi:SAM-dependent methyltransferase